MLIVNVNREPLPPAEESATLESRTFSSYGATYRSVRTHTASEVVDAARNADVILFTAARFDESVFSQLPNLKLMVRYGVGYDTVDLAAARRHSVNVCNAPAYGSYDVAEHAFALLMSANRKIPQYDAAIRRGGWGGSADYPIYRLEGKTLGTIGFGRIARNVARFAKGFGMRTVAYDPFLPPDLIRDGGSEPLSLDELYRQSDFISINAPLTDDTRHMINANAFRMMKPTAVLVNTARGALVDEDALYNALASRTIRAAGIDVYENYPKDAGNRFHKLDNVVFTPHVAWNSVESAEALHQEVVDEVVRFLKGEPNLNVVNR